MVSETRSHRLNQGPVEGVRSRRRKRRSMLSPTALQDVVPTTPNSQLEETISQVQFVKQGASVLLRDLIPVLKSLTANKDEELYIDSILSSFLETCTFLEDGRPSKSRDKKKSDGPKDSRPQWAEAGPRDSISQMKTLIDRRLHFQSASSTTTGSPSHTKTNGTDAAVPQSQPSTEDSSAQLGKPTPSLITDNSPNEILLKISDPQTIIFLQRYPPEALRYLVNNLLSTNPDTLVQSVQVVHAALLKSGDLSIEMRNSKERNIIESRPECLERFLPSAKAFMPSYKVLMKGIRPFTVKLVDSKDEKDFVRRLQDENTALKFDAVGLIDFEPREDLSRRTTIAIEFLELDDANAAVKMGLLWESQRKETEHYNLTCNLNFPSLHEKYCDEVRARRVDERLRKEEEDKKDAMLRHSKIFEPFTALALANVEDFLSQDSVWTSTTSIASAKGKRKQSADTGDSGEAPTKRHRLINQEAEFIELSKSKEVLGMRHQRSSSPLPMDGTQCDIVPRDVDSTSSSSGSDDDNSDEESKAREDAQVQADGDAGHQLTSGKKRQKRDDRRSGSKVLSASAKNGRNEEGGGAPTKATDNQRGISNGTARMKEVQMAPTKRGMKRDERGVPIVMSTYEADQKNSAVTDDGTSSASENESDDESEDKSEDKSKVKLKVKSRDKPEDESGDSSESVEEERRFKPKGRGGARVYRA